MFYQWYCHFDPRNCLNFDLQLLENHSFFSNSFIYEKSLVFKDFSNDTWYDGFCKKKTSWPLSQVLCHVAQ